MQRSGRPYSDTDQPSRRAVIAVLDSCLFLGIISVLRINSSGPLEPWTARWLAWILSAISSTTDHSDNCNNGGVERGQHTMAHRAKAICVIA
jgi:hypothetical protein